MKKAFPFFISFVLACAVFLFWQSSLPPVESAGQVEQPMDLANYDIRTAKSEAAQAALINFRRQSGFDASLPETERQKTTAAEDALRQRLPFLKIEYGERLQIPEIVSTDAARKNGEWLSAPSEAKRADILRSFIKQNSALFGLDDRQANALKTTADYAHGNLAFAHLEQEINGLRVFQGEIKAGFTRRGEIVRVVNNLAPWLDTRNLSTEATFSAERAIGEAAKFIGVTISENDTRRAESAAGDKKIRFERGQFADATTAEKIYFPVGPGAARLAWQILLWRETDAFYVVVDAQDGTLLWRKNIAEYQTQAATYNVYGSATSMMKTADSPTAFTPGCLMPNPCPQPPIINRQSFTLIGNEPPNGFNFLGWIQDGENRTIGNNAEAGIDRQAPNGVDDNGWAFGSPNRNFVYNYNPAPGNPSPGEEPLPPQPQTYPPSAFQQGSITNAFYAVNRFHDELYRLGFIETARNFQIDNFGRGGIGNDSISVEVQDSLGTNLTNFFTPADGGRGRLQLTIWTTPTPDRDGALDNQLIVHELTHGVSNRLHGNATGLSSNMSRGMGEGWSDFYALALLSEPTDNPLGTYTIAGYLTHEMVAGFPNYYYGIRRFPTAVMASVGPNGLPHNPLTFKHLNSNCDTTLGTTTMAVSSAFPRNPVFSPSSSIQACDQINNAGELWNVTLWEVRGQLTLIHGATEGNRRALQYVTDGMKLAPLNPTMLQARDAIVIAAQVRQPGDLPAVWRGFAIRGLGLNASIQNAGTGTNNAAVTEAFNIPAQYRSVRADFDGDGKSDVSVYRTFEGIWYVNRSGNGFAATRWGLEHDVLAPGDFDGDGITDLSVFRPSNDAGVPDFYILNSSNSTFSFVSFGNVLDIPIIEDYDADGKSDVAVFRRDTSHFYVLKSTGGFLTAQIGNGAPTPNAVPVAGDFDGDGKGDFTYTLSNPTNTSPIQWYIRKSSNNYNPQFFAYGLGTDKMVVADYDGDGADDMAVFRPSNGFWYIRRSLGGDSYIQFGANGDVPAPGDFDGDGKYDLAVFRHGTWYLNQSTAGFTGGQFGISGDIPIPNRYLP
ncbi:MAG TPA: M36 family metallopeptidase [Pyrinomonadaceae bacterium]